VDPLEARARRVINWLSLVIIVVFGGATLLLQDKTFIMWKPTVLYGLFGRSSPSASSGSAATSSPT
jgi:intracellular septation protein A